VVGDEHGGGHRGAASSGKYSCDAPHRGSLAFPTTSKSVLQAMVGGRNPAPVDVVNIPLFTRFYTSQVVQHFFHQQYLWDCKICLRQKKEKQKM